MNPQALTRQFDLIPESCLSKPITVIGAGAIGSFTVLTLAKMGFSDITVYDFDKIEIENLNSQFYRTKDIGHLKVDALEKLVEDFTGSQVRGIAERFMGGNLSGQIVVAAVDSMVSRRIIWEASRASADWFIDPRMGSETALLYAMNPSSDADIESYEKSLYSDEEALQERCTAKATMYCALSLSALVAKTVKDLAAGFPYTRTATWSVKNSQLTAWVKEGTVGRTDQEEGDGAGVLRSVRTSPPGEGQPSAQARAGVSHTTG